jgi:recombination protein U
MAQGKRGKPLENAIEYTNNIYKNKGVALVDKVPTPWNVSYNRKTGKVFKAFPQKKGTVDFIGISHGRGVAFDAKSTNNSTSFPLGNIEDHQIKYLLNHKDQGGIAFIIVEFANYGEHYFLTIDELNEWWVASQNGGRKSIPYRWFVMYCEQIRSEKGVPLHYLKFCTRK